MGMTVRRFGLKPRFSIFEELALETQASFKFNLVLSFMAAMIERRSYYDKADLRCNWFES